MYMYTKKYFLFCSLAQAMQTPVLWITKVIHRKLIFCPNLTQPITELNGYNQITMIFSAHFSAFLIDVEKLLESK